MAEMTNRPRVYHRRHSWRAEAIVLAGIVLFGSYAFVIDGRLASAPVVSQLTQLIH